MDIYLKVYRNFCRKRAKYSYVFHREKILIKVISSLNVKEINTNNDRINSHMQLH